MAWERMYTLHRQSRCFAAMVRSVYFVIGGATVRFYSCRMKNIAGRIAYALLLLSVAWVLLVALIAFV